MKTIIAIAMMLPGICFFSAPAQAADITGSIVVHGLTAKWDAIPAHFRNPAPRWQRGPDRRRSAKRRRHKALHHAFRCGSFPHQRSIVHGYFGPHNRKTKYRV